MRFQGRPYFERKMSMIFLIGIDMLDMIFFVNIIFR